MRLIRVYLLRSDLVEVWVKTEGKEEEKKGRKRERKRKIERDRDRKDIGWVKDSGEVWKYKEYSLLVIFFFFFLFLTITLYIY